MFSIFFRNLIHYINRHFHKKIIAHFGHRIIGTNMNRDTHWEMHEGGLNEDTAKDRRRNQKNVTGY